jgi:predicted dehydrogenase
MTHSQNQIQAPLRIALVGLGKIAIDQHLPAIRANPALALVAGCAPEGGIAGLPCYRDLDTMLAFHPEIDALALCTPPQVRFGLARRAMEAGKHLLLEKPPAATADEAQAIAALAARHGVTVLAGWHSRYAPAIERMRDWVGAHPVRSVRVTWREDVNQWHPGQAWLFEAGGTGVFDPGINALSILTALLPGAVQVRDAQLYVPSNCVEPIRADLTMVLGQGVAAQAQFDFLQPGEPTWSMLFDAGPQGAMTLHAGGRRLDIDGRMVVDAPDREYPRMYAHFAALVAAGASDLDFTPLHAVIDALAMGQRHRVDPF